MMNQINNIHTNGIKFELESSDVSKVIPIMLYEVGDVKLKNPITLDICNIDTYKHSVANPDYLVDFSKMIIPFIAATCKKEYTYDAIVKEYVVIMDPCVDSITAYFVMKIDMEMTPKYVVYGLFNIKGDSKVKFIRDL